MPRLLSQRKKVNPPAKLDNNRFSYLNLQNAQPALGPAPTANEGYTIQTDSSGKATFANTLGKLSFANSTITNTQATDIIINNSGNGNIILDPNTLLQINGNTNISGNTNIGGDIVVSGNNPIGTAPVVNNVLYVNENGDDSNDGRAMDSSRAKRTISGAVKSPYYQEGTTIRVASGHYWEDNPIQLKPSTCVIGDDLRTTFIEPLNKDVDLFWVNSGVYIAQMAMINLRKGSVTRYAPGGAGTYTTGAYAVAFPPLLENPIDVYYSPYIQNCTNQSGPWLFDGTMFRPNQTVQVPLGAGTASWAQGVSTLTVAMSTGSVAIGMAINDIANSGYQNAQELLLINIPFFQAEVNTFISTTYPNLDYDVSLSTRDIATIITGVAGDCAFGGNLRARDIGAAYWDGTISVLGDSQSACIAAFGYLQTLASNVVVNNLVTSTYQSTVTQIVDNLLIGGSIVTATLVNSFNVIETIVSNGLTAIPSPIDMDYGLITPSGLSSDEITNATTITNITSTSTGLANAQILLQANKSFIQSETVAWVNQQYPTLVYNSATCYRDVGLIVDAISIDGIIGGNIQSVIAGLAYYTGVTSNIPGEITQTIGAINYINSLSQQIITNTPVTKLSTATQIILSANTGGGAASVTIAASAAVIANIVENGPTSVPDTVYPSLDQYVVTLSTSSITSAIDSTIYFGYTTVYPVQDKDIPNEWVATRSLNPQGSGGGALIDGNAPSSKSPIQSFVFDAFTQLNQGGIGIHIINNGYAQLVSVFTIFCDVGVLTENGGIASITNSNANFGNFALVSKGLGHLEFAGILWNPPYPSNVENGQYYPLGYWPQNGLVEVYIPDEINRPHIGLTMEVVPPKTYIDYTGARVPYVNAEGYPGFLAATPNTSTITAGAFTIENIDTDGICIGHTLYITDETSSNSVDGVMYVSTGTTVIDVNFNSVTLDQPINVSAGDPTNDLYFNLYFCGNAYYNVLSSTVDPTVSQPNTVTFIPGEIDETSAAIRYANEVVQAVITNSTLTNSYTSTEQYFNLDYTNGSHAGSLLEDKFNIIADIIQYGQLTAPTIVKNSQIKNTDQGVLNAAKLIDANKTFIQDQVTSFVDTEFVGFNYDQAKCYRDTGLIVDSIAFDLLYGGYSQAIFAGLQYWNQDGYTGRIPSEIVTTTNTINYIGQLAQEIVTGETGIRYQTAISQVTGLPLSDESSAETIADEFSIITNILTSGTTGVTDIIVPNGIASTTSNIINAYNLLQANKEYIQAEAIAFVEATKNSTFNYDRVKCARDTGILVDSFVTDLLFSGNGYTQSNFAGLQYWSQNGYTGNIPSEITTTTAAISYLQQQIAALIPNSAAITNADFDVLLNILSSGTVGVTEMIVANGIEASTVTSVIADYNTLISSTSTLVSEVISYINTNNPGFVYNTSTCQRDVVYIVNSIAFDLLYGGNRQAIQSAVYYYTYSTSSNVVSSEITQVTAAYNRLKTILPQIVTGQTVSASTGNTIVQVTDLTTATSVQATSLQNMVTLVTNIITNGPGVALEPTPVSLTMDTSTSVVDAVALLEANKEFIEREIIAYIDSTNSVNTFYYNTTTCARDTGIIIDSIVLDALFPNAYNSQSTFAGLQYYAQGDYTGNIASEITTTTNSINYLSQLAQEIIQGNTGTRYTTATQIIELPATSVEAETIANEFSIITNILTSGTTGVTDLIEANGITKSTSTNINKAYSLLQNNRTYMQNEVIAYINATTTSSFSYNTATCFRDVGYIIDSVSFDLLYGGNRQAIQSGVYYYSFNNSASQIVGETTQTIAAFNFIGTLITNLVTGESFIPLQNNILPVTDLSTATSVEASVFVQNINTITNIISSGTSVITSKTPISLVMTTSTNMINAASIVEANREFIVAETLQYINQTYNFFYDANTCARDVSYIIDSVSFDLLHGGNRQAVMSGVYYYGFSPSESVIDGNRLESQYAYDHISDIATNLITGVPITTVYQTTVTQVTSVIPATPNEATQITDIINTITNIIVNGPQGYEPTPITLTASTNTNVQNAFNTLLANRAFIQAETIAFVNAQFEPFNYNSVKCARDTGLIIDSLAIDLLYQGSSQSNFAALQYWNQDGYTGQIGGELSTTTQAINYVSELAQLVVQGITSGTRYQNTVTQVTNLPTASSATAAIIASEFNIITNILNNGITGITDQIISNGSVSTSTDIQHAYALLEVNKAYLQAEAIAYTNTIASKGFTFNTTSCYRDTGLIVDSLAFDLLYGGQSQSTFAALQYWNQSTTTDIIPGELSTTTQAIQYLQSLVVAIVNAAGGSTASSVVNNNFNTIVGILNSGTTGVTNLIVPNGSISTATTTTNAYNAIETTKATLITEVVNYINTNNPGFSYNTSTCSRDVGFIIDSIAFDLLCGGNRQSIMSAVYYYGYTTSTVLVSNDMPETISAYELIKTYAENIITGELISFPYQQSVKQVLSTSTGTTVELAIIDSNIDYITDVISNGPSAANSKTPITFTPSSTATTINSYNLLLANREFIQAELVAYTQYEYSGPYYDRTKCRRDTGLIVDALSQDLLFGGQSQSNFAGLQYWSPSGYTGQIGSEVTTTTNTINFINQLAQEIVQGITTGFRLAEIDQSVQNTSLPPATVNEAEIISENLTLIANIISNGTAGVTDLIEPNSLMPSTSTNIVNAYNLLIANKVYIQAQAVAFVEDTRSSEFLYNQATCYRDVGYIIDSIAFDLLYGGNRQSIQSGVAYYAYSSNFSVVTNEIYQTTAAYERISQIVPDIVQNILITNPYQSIVPQVLQNQSATVNEANQIIENVTLITNIISNGPSSAIERSPIGLIASTTATVISAAALLEANKSFITEEVIAYVNQTLQGYQYNQATCYRDVGYMIDSVAFDLLHGGNRQAIQSGACYYDFSSDETVIENEISQTTSAYNFIGNLVTNIIAATTITNTYQTATIQVTNLPGTTESTVLTSINNNISLITDVIANGPSVANPLIPVGLTESSDSNVINAYNLLVANRSFIIAEVIAYINETFVRFSYNRNKCYRDVNSIIDAVVYDVLYGGNYRSVNTGNGYYARQGRYHIVNLEQNVTDPTQFIDGATVNFYQTSYQSASGYLFEYIGAGANYSALPQIGRADPIQSHETVQLSNGKVFFTSTDQNGDFRIGPGLVISQATGILYGRTFQKSLYAEMTPFILVIGGT